MKLQLSDNGPLNDESFGEFLHESDLREEYTKAAKEADSVIAKEFDEAAAHKSKYQDRDDKITLLDKYHRETLNACIYPFSQKGSLKELGYYFIRSEPLLEKKVDNVDFLIASDTKGIAIFGEAKTSSADSSGIIAEMKERRKVIEEHKEYLNEVLIPGIDNFEFVFGLPAIEARDLSATILKNENLDYIVWSYGGPDSHLILSLYVPPGEKWDSLRRIRHADNELNTRLIRVPTSKTYKNFFLQSHPVAKMAVLTWIDTGREEDTAKGRFTRSELVRICSIELEAYCKDIIERQVELILELALKIEFIKAIEDQKEIYKIVTTSNDPKARYEDLKTKWIEYSIAEERKKKLDIEREKLQQKFRVEKQRRYPPLIPFDDPATRA